MIVENWAMHIVSITQKVMSSNLTFCKYLYSECCKYCDGDECNGASWGDLADQFSKGNVEKCHTCTYIDLGKKVPGSNLAKTIVFIIYFFKISSKSNHH